MQPVDAHAAANAHLAPVAAGERIMHLDVLRGVALFGVLIANIWLWFSGAAFRIPELNLGAFTLDTVAFYAVAILVSGKAMTTFSFLFGLGFAVQMLRAEAKGLSVGPTYARRLAILLLIGAAHAILLWYGDILVTYALLGFALLLFRRRTDKTLLIWAVVLFALVPLAIEALPLITERTGPEATEQVATKEAAATAATEPATTAADETAAGAAAAGGQDAGAATETPDAAGKEVDDRAARDAEMLAAFRSREPARIIEGNLKALADRYGFPRVLRYAWVLGVFLIGLWVGRRRVFEHVSDYRPLWKKLVVWGFPVGLVMAAVGAVLRGVFFGGGGPPPTWGPVVLDALGIIELPFFAAAYIAAVVLLLERDRWRRVLSAFAPVGRMALTNYVMQTVICLILYIGAGLMATAGSAVGLLLAFVIFGAQMVLSAWWLNRYRFGPLEWLWRSATYGRLQPMRRPVEGPVEGRVVSV